MRLRRAHTLLPLGQPLGLSLKTPYSSHCLTPHRFTLEAGDGDPGSSPVSCSWGSESVRFPTAPEKAGEKRDTERLAGEVAMVEETHWACHPPQRGRGGILLCQLRTGGGGRGRETELGEAGRGWG